MISLSRKRKEEKQRAKSQEPRAKKTEMRTDGW